MNKFVADGKTDNLLEFVLFNYDNRDSVTKKFGQTK